MSVSLYFDHAATTPLLPQARDALLDGLARWANPSSPHRDGRAARAALEDARARIKAALGWSGEVVLTSGASEALALAIGRSKAPLVAVSAVEHEAVLRLAGQAVRLPVDARGQVDPATCALAGLVAVQQVNNETGVIQPLAEVAGAVRGAGGVLLAGVLIVWRREVRGLIQLLRLQGGALALIPFVAGEEAFAKLPNLKRLVDEVNARPAAAKAIALKDNFKFKAEMDDAARATMFKHLANKVA